MGCAGQAQPGRKTRLAFKASIGLNNDRTCRSALQQNGKSFSLIGYLGRPALHAKASGERPCACGQPKGHDGTGQYNGG
jgi:hypothetical protein